MATSKFNIPIDVFNYHVNHSGDLFQKYNNWIRHREQIMTLIDQGQGDNPDKKSVIVFGAGGCNDLDLSHLAKHFNRIVLTDVDTESMYEGIRRQNLDTHVLSKITIERVEYTGFESVNFFEGLQQHIDNQSPIFKILAFIENTMEAASCIQILEKYRGAFQMVLSTPVYTQLILTQLSVVLDALKEENYYELEDVHQIGQTFLGYMPKVIRNYNDLLVSMACSDAVIAVWSDILQFDPKHDTMAKIKKLLANTYDERAIEQYVEKDGMGIGTYGCKDLLEKIELKGSQWWVWPFDTNRHFLVKGLWGLVKD